ncbi:hypothetical protein DFP72DRAFT_846173 [Ephemerocybe angulata]|uniref:Uncharacterized protein n=1 Tax=Ephemerocybe angulata TaxID=980116 RepID=A0A8H6I4H9_9AGAR|nr:hypothetical protein DFP72DRAFT_846173 [Tulosesus angulatus]
MTSLCFEITEVRRPTSGCSKRTAAYRCFFPWERDYWVRRRYLHEVKHDDREGQIDLGSLLKSVEKEVDDEFWKASCQWDFNCSYNAALHALDKLLHERAITLDEARQFRQAAREAKSEFESESCQIISDDQIGGSGTRANDSHRLNLSVTRSSTTSSSVGLAYWPEPGAAPLPLPLTWSKVVVTPRATLEGYAEADALGTLMQ